MGEDKIWSLTYADDIIIVANNREAIKDMIDTFGRILKDRGMEISTGKTNIVVFNRKGKERFEKWKWGKKEIKEVKEYKYLGYSFSRNGEDKEHIKELRRKRKLAANKIWGLGEKICRDDFGRRRMLFNYLVKSVMTYGAEIWR